MEANFPAPALRRLRWPTTMALFFLVGMAAANVEGWSRFGFNQSDRHTGWSMLVRNLLLTKPAGLVWFGSIIFYAAIAEIAVYRQAHSRFRDFGLQGVYATYFLLIALKLFGLDLIHHSTVVISDICWLF